MSLASGGGGTAASSAEAQALLLQATIKNLSSGKCTQAYTKQAQAWLRAYQQTREAWTVSLLFLRDPARCRSPTELFFHAQTLHEKVAQLGNGSADNSLDAAGLQRLKLALFEMGLAHSANRVVCSRVARAFATLAIHAGDWGSLDPLGPGGSDASSSAASSAAATAAAAAATPPVSTAVCAEVASFCCHRPSHVTFALLALTSLAEEIRSKHSRESRRHRLLVLTALRHSSGVVVRLLELLLARADGVPETQARVPFAAAAAAAAAAGCCCMVLCLLLLLLLLCGTGVSMVIMMTSLSCGGMSSSSPPPPPSPPAPCIDCPLHCCNICCCSASRFVVAAGADLRLPHGVDQHRLLERTRAAGHVAPAVCAGPAGPPDALRQGASLLCSFFTRGPSTS